MSLYKVVVENLRKRQSPVINFDLKNNITGIVSKDFQFESVAEIVNPLGAWYKDREGSYYWGGGLVKVEENDLHYPYWIKNNLFSIPDLWKRTKGASINIALLDTGINSNTDLNLSQVKGYNYVDENNNYNIDIVGHGTHCAGIIAAQGTRSFGVAPGVNLFCAKVCNDSGVPSFPSVLNALNDIYLNQKGFNNISIINMSFCLVPTNQDEANLNDQIIEVIDKISKEKNCLLVAACGDIDEERDNFPALSPQCISVGSIGMSFQRSVFSTRSSTLDIMAPGENIFSSYKTDQTIMLSGTSMSAAFVSGVCALGAGIMKENDKFNANLLQKILFQSAASNNYPLKEYGHGIISPENFINNLKSISK